MEQENKSELGEWIFCFIIATIFMGIGRLLYKPFEESNIIFKFFGILSIIALLFVVFMTGLTQFGSNPIHPVVLIPFAGVYCIFAFVSFICRSASE